MSFQIAFELCFYKGSLDGYCPPQIKLMNIISTMNISFQVRLFETWQKNSNFSDCKIFLIKSVSIWLQISKRHSVLIGKYNTGASKLASMHLTYESITSCSSARSIITSIYLSISITLGSICIVCMGFNLFAFCWYPYRRIIIWEECVQGQ